MSLHLQEGQEHCYYHFLIIQSLNIWQTSSRLRKPECPVMHWDYSWSWGTGRGLVFATSYNNSRVSFVLSVDHWSKFPVAQWLPSELRWTVSLCMGPIRGMIVMKSLNMILTPFRCRHSWPLSGWLMVARKGCCLCHSGVFYKFSWTALFNCSHAKREY